MVSIDFNVKVFAAPTKVAVKVAEVHESNLAVKKRLHDEMNIEQNTFVKSLHEMEQQVCGAGSNHLLRNSIQIMFYRIGGVLGRVY